MTEHKKNSEESVENNLASDYIPKGKLGNLPIQNGIDTEEKKKMDKLQKEIKKYTDEISKTNKFIEAVGIIPAQAAKEIEEEYEISAEDAKEGLIHILTIIPEKQFKNIGKIRLDCINTAKKINKKLWVHVMTPVDVWNLGLDSKFEVMEALSMSYPVLDKGLLASLRVSQIHKSLVLKKFEKYVTSYIIAGSLTRGDTVKTSDVDVAIIIDDTDVKRMPRLELKEKLRSIIYTYIQDAQAMAGVKSLLNVQIWLLTEFWDGVKDAHPVFFTFIRDGIALYDRGNFLPWKSLLRMGKIKPSPEAIDMFMSSGIKLKETVNKRIFDIATLDLFWGISTPTQGLLMLYGMAPPTPKETVKLFREIFYEKEKLVEKKYVDILEEIMIKVWKGYEHGKVKPGDISGSELERLSKNAIDYMDRILKLRDEIEKRVQEKSIEDVYNDLFGMIGSFLNKKSEISILNAFNSEFIKEGIFPPRYLKWLKNIAKVRKQMQEKKKTKKGKKKSLTAKQGEEVSKAQVRAEEIIKAITEYAQRIELSKTEKSRYILRSKNKDIELFFLKDTFVIHEGQIERIVEGIVKKSSVQELQKQLVAQKEKKVVIDLKALETLKKMYGDFELIS